MSCSIPDLKLYRIVLLQSVIESLYTDLTKYKIAPYRIISPHFILLTFTTVHLSRRGQ